MSAFILFVVIKQDIEINSQELKPIFEDDSVVSCIDGTLCRLLRGHSILHSSGKPSVPSPVHVSRWSYIVHYLVVRVAVW